MLYYSILKVGWMDGAPLYSLPPSVLRHNFKFTRSLINFVDYFRPLTKESKLQNNIRELKDKNLLLSRLNSELQQENKEVSH